MKFDMKKIAQDYKAHSTWKRELGKWLFSIFTFGIGALHFANTTRVIKEGYVGLRRDARGRMILLPPGRHSNFPWESYPVEPQPLSQKNIQLGPYKIITVETGYVGKTTNHGNLEMLPVGQHLLTEAAHVFQEFIPVKQETKKLHAVTAYTSDNVGLTLQADVRYQIENPELANRQVDDVENSIKEIAEMSISQIVSHHKLVDFAPATSSVEQRPAQGIGEVIHELANNIRAQFQKLGIALINIGITSWTINDKELAHELAQGAVIQSQTASKMVSAQRAAEVKAIEAQADANAMRVRADAESAAIQKRGQAIHDVATRFKDNPAAQAIFDRQQQIQLVEHARSPYLFLSQTNSPSAMPKLNLPVPNVASDVAGATL